ncbi:hypothetical protein C0993_005586, partial [Termitomyces sp. T159_Od127]
MTSAPNSHGIPAYLSNTLLQSTKLADDNWTEWSENMEMFFMGLGADWVSSGTVDDADLKMDKALVAYIFAAMEPEQRYCIKGIKSATTAWDTLKKAYQ